MTAETRSDLQRLHTAMHRTLSAIIEGDEAALPKLIYDVRFWSREVAERLDPNDPGMQGEVLVEVNP